MSSASSRSAHKSLIQRKFTIMPQQDQRLKSERAFIQLNMEQVSNGKLNNQESKGKVQDSHKVKPPFTGVPSFLVAATIMSYYSFHHQARTLLRRVSKNGGRYYVQHKRILQEFFIVWRPEFVDTIAFFADEKDRQNLLVFETMTQEKLVKHCKWGFKQNLSRYSGGKVHEAQHKISNQRIKLFGSGLQFNMHTGEVINYTAAQLRFKGHLRVQFYYNEKDGFLQGVSTYMLDDHDESKYHSWFEHLEDSACSRYATRGKNWVNVVLYKMRYIFCQFMKDESGRKYIYKLSFAETESECKQLMELTQPTDSQGDRISTVVKEVPPGQQIIGLSFYEDGLALGRISGIEFITWYPEPLNKQRDFLDNREALLESKGLRSENHNQKDWFDQEVTTEQKKQVNCQVYLRRQ